MCRGALPLEVRGVAVRELPSPQRRGAQERFAYLLCEFLLLFTCPRPVQPGVGHLRTFSCMART